jgi:hypothetical protein
MDVAFPVPVAVGLIVGVAARLAFLANTWCKFAVPVPTTKLAPARPPIVLRACRRDTFSLNHFFKSMVLSFSATSRRYTRRTKTARHFE